MFRKNSSRKSFDVVIKGYANYLNTYKDIKTKLLVVGDGPAISELKDLVNQFKINDYVKFVGKVNINETQYYYRSADIFLNASTSETQGLTFMEAMASNLIVLCRFDNSLLGVIDNKLNGFFYINTDDLKDKLHDILLMKEEDKDLIKKEHMNLLIDSLIKHFIVI